jgi:truncated hemoglobin YjbI
MITEHQEVARHRVAEQIRAAEMRALRNESKVALRAAGETSGPRHELAGVLRRLADRLEPQPRHRRTGLSVVR